MYHETAPVGHLIESLQRAVLRAKSLASMRALAATALSSLGLFACAASGTSSTIADRASSPGTTNGSAGMAGAVFDVQAHLLASAAGEESEGVPSGVPAQWDWVAAATPTRTAPPGPQYTHANYWGALFRGLGDVTPPNTVVQIRDCSMWLLVEGSADWVKTDASVKLGGSTFSPTYAGGGPAPLWLAPVATGLDVVPAEGHIYHFWQENGYQPLPLGVREIVTNCQASLGLRDDAAGDDRAQADYLVHVGADFRDPKDPSCAADQDICPSWGVSRLERIATTWRNHTFHSLTQQDLSSGLPLPPASIFQLQE